MAIKGPMPPHLQVEGFLPEEQCRALLDWAIGEQSSFNPAVVFTGPGGQETRVDPKFRNTVRTCDLGPFEDVFRDALLARLPEFASAIGDSASAPCSIEFELNAYGEGAHFRPHIDIPVGPDRRPIGKDEGEDRVISAVYYFHSEPKRFSGGALRLYRFGVRPSDAEDADFLSFEPRQNSLVVFPSWAMHGVEVVHCPSGEFRDFRFALNCWFCRPAGS